MPTGPATGSIEAARAVLAANRAGRRVALTSLCSAHPLALEAGIAAARDHDQVALIEATCNQVNQEGGYTGSTPERFARRVGDLAGEAGLPRERLLLGGDHLGPQPWRDRPAAEAMARARAMVAAYARAGFGKLHLDCSMACAGDPDPPPEEVVAERAAHLAAAAEAEAPGTPLYVVGTEVPPPGGMGSGHRVVPTPPERVAATWEAHRAAFARAGLDGAFERVAAIVVQPGLDFGNEEVVAFDPEAARPLTAALRALPGAVFEAHSTDHQPPDAYPALVEGGFAILKVGPAATFALREALYALEAVEAEVVPERDRSRLRDALEAAMLADPRHWRSHHDGPRAEHLRHHSLSDRVRYYWAVPEVEAACERLFANLDGRDWPRGLLDRHLPGGAGALPDRAPRCAEVAVAHVRRALAPYHRASGPHGP